MPSEDNIANTLMRIKSDSALNTVLVTCRWSHRIQQWVTLEEISDDLVAKDEECRDLK